MAVKTPKQETPADLALAKMEPWSEALGKSGHADFSVRGVVLRGSYTLAQGMELLTKWHGINQLSKVAIGDILGQLESRFGEKYAQAMSLSGLEYGTIANYISTCKRVPYDVRPDALLSMRVLAAVAPLADYDGGRLGQEEILAEAATDNLTSDAVRIKAWEWRARREIAILEPLVEDGIPDLDGLFKQAQAEAWPIDELRDRVYQIKTAIENPIDPPVVKNGESGAVEPDEILPPEEGGELRNSLEMLADMWEASAESIMENQADTIENRYTAEVFRRCARDLRQTIKRR